MIARKLHQLPILLVVCAVVATFATTGCNPRRSASIGFDPYSAFPNVPVVPPSGFLYSKFSAPLMYDFTETPVSTKPPVELESWRLYIPLFGGPSAAIGDVSFQSLAQEAGFNVMYYADYEVTNYLTILSFTKFRLYGE